MPQHATKRPREASAEDIRAECPFSIRVVDPRQKDLRVKSRKRRKSRHSSVAPGASPAPAADGDGDPPRVLHQCAPFEPKGRFETNENLDVHYVVEPSRQWAEMTRYNSFVLNSNKYYCEGFIYVANESSIERQKQNGGAPDPGLPGKPRKRSDDDWVARILEIRASDEHHVYARVFWMYWPDELPAGTRCGRRVVQGRQPYHGHSELIASNHMDIINVVSVTGKAEVNQLDEDNDDDVQNQLYWRQALDVRTMELTTVEGICDCGQPANPDKLLVGCGEYGCRQWLHPECLRHYALMRIYERLGRDKPHVSDPDARAEDAAAAARIKSEMSADVKAPLSPRETGGAVSAQHSIDVKADGFEDQGADEDAYEATVANVSGGQRAAAAAAQRRKKAATWQASVPMKPLKRETTPPATEDHDAPAAATGLATPTAASSTVSGATPKGNSKSKGAATAAAAATAATTTATVAPLQPGHVTCGKRRYPTLQSFEGKRKPYDKLFSATLLLTPLTTASWPTLVEVHDLRTNVTGGEKVWFEHTECPLCGAPIR